MNALVVFESVYGNTRRLAEAIAEGLGGATVTAVQRAPSHLDDVDLLVVGGPTHMHGLSTSLSRRMAVEGASEDGHAPVDPAVAEEPGLRQWLHGLSATPGLRAAAFDTRLDRSSGLTGTAARGIARRLHRRGLEVIATGSFLVEDADGPLEEGELERARDWGALLATAVAEPVAP